MDFTDVEMTENKFIYAGWRPIRYRAWVQPNGGVLSVSESTWFNLDYGETVGDYSDITRDYLRDDAGEYIYVIYDHEDPRSAGYVKFSEATDDQKAHALKDGDSLIQYKYLKNAYTFVGWYEVLDEEFGTYEQYYANGNSNDGEYTVRPPSINESDSLSASPYIFGSPVGDDIALRAIWKRAGTIAVQFDPAMTGTSTIRRRMRLKGLSVWINIKQTILTIITISRKFVPQRLCSRVQPAAFSGVSCMPASMQFMVLCSAPWYIKTRCMSFRREIAAM